MEANPRPAAFSAHNGVADQRVKQRKNIFRRKRLKTTNIFGCLSIEVLRKHRQSVPYSAGLRCGQVIAPLDDVF